MDLRAVTASKVFLCNLLFLTVYIAGCGQGKSTPTGSPSSNPPANQPGGSTRTLASVTVSPASASLAAGATQQFTATAKYSDGSTTDATSSASWKSSNSAIATVSASGLAKGVAAGTASITATLQSVSGSASVTVQAGSGGGSSGGSGSATSQYLLYASLQSMSLLSGWIFDTAASPASLTATPGSPYASGSGPTQLAFSPDGKFLYGLAQQTMPEVRGSNCYDYPDELDAWSVDHASGALTLIQQLTLHDNCGYMAMDPSGTFLYVTQTSVDSSGYIDVARIDSTTGKMTLTSGSPYKFAQVPLYAAVAGNFLYAVQWGSSSSPGMLIFKRDTTTGDVQYQASQTFAGMQDLDRLTVSPSGGTLYGFSSSTSGAITSYSINPSTGSLTQQATTATAANGFSIAADPTGKYLAAASSKGVYVFTVQSGGALTPIPGSPFGTTAVAAKFDASGQHLAVVSIDSATGNRVVNVYSVSGTGVSKQASAASANYVSDVVMEAK